MLVGDAFMQECRPANMGQGRGVHQTIQRGLHELQNPRIQTTLNYLEHNKGDAAGRQAARGPGERRGKV